MLAPIFAILAVEATVQLATWAIPFIPRISPIGELLALLGLNEFQFQTALEVPQAAFLVIGAAVIVVLLIKGNQ